MFEQLAKQGCSNSAGLGRVCDQNRLNSILHLVVTQTMQRGQSTFGEMKNLPHLIEDCIGCIADWYAFRTQQPRAKAPDPMPVDAIGRIVSDDEDLSRPFILSDSQRARHLYVLGATGSGKTNLILQLLAQDLAQGRSIVVVDLRGDLIDRLLLRLSEEPDSSLQERTVLLDLRDAERIIGFNPLSGTAEAHSRAYLVLDALRNHADSWGVQLEETLRNTLIALAEDNRTLLDIEPFLTDADFRLKVLGGVNDPSVRAFFSRYGALSLDKQQAWFLPVLNKVTPLLGIPRLRLLFGANPALQVSRLLDTPGQIVLVALAVDRFHSASRLVGSLIIGAIEAAIMSRVDIPEASRVPVNLYVDEFETMASEAFGSIVAEGRRFRLSLTLSHQNLSQIPTGLRQVIRNNVQTQILFQTGSIDARELRSELVQLEGDGATELQTLPVGEAFVLCRPDEPVRVRFRESRDPSVSKEQVRKFIQAAHLTVGSTAVSGAVKESKGARTGQGAGSDPVTSEAPADPPVRHQRLPRRIRGRE